MKGMDLARQQWNEYQSRKLREAEQAEHDAKLARTKAQVQKVFDADVLTQLMSDVGYKGYRIQLDEYECEWEVQDYTSQWGWNRINSLGFKQGHVTIYKTLSGACRRIKNELER